MQRAWHRLRLFGCTLIASASASSCAPPADFHGPEPVGRTEQAISVGEAVSGGCSTNAVAGLSAQIVEQMNCLIPGGALAEVPARPNFSKGGATLAWMQPPAVAALVAALDENQDMSLGANSMLRTVAQQYLLYRWYQAGQCNISLAATPGSSNHESGLAIDVSEWEMWQTALEAHDFGWLGSNDAVHFDYEGPGVVDLSGKDVLAFQMIWNANNANDQIVEDGLYGSNTEARLEQSPAEGFTTPPTCTGGGGGNAGRGGSAGGGSGGAGGAGGSADGGVIDAGAAGGTGGAAGGGQGGTASQRDSGAGPGTSGVGATGGRAPITDGMDDSPSCDCRQGPKPRPAMALPLLGLVIAARRLCFVRRRLDRRWTRPSLRRA